MAYVLLMFRNRHRNFHDGYAVVGPFQTSDAALKHATPLPDGGVWAMSVLNAPPPKPKAKKSKRKR